jgi:hypothetical protein
MKKFYKKIRAYISTFYMRTIKFRGKPTFLVLCVKKTKHVTYKPLFSTEFYLFYLDHKESRFFINQLGSCKDCEEVHATYFFEFF